MKKINKFGKSTVNLYATDFENGIYTYSLIADGNILLTNKMVIQK
jgi:hypothetical protein